MLFVPKLAKLLPAAGLAALFLCWAQASQAGVIFEIEVDTTGFDSSLVPVPLTGTTGSLDFQFSPAYGAPAATAMVYDFTSDGTLVPGPALKGDASGDLSSGPLTFDNGEPGDTTLPPLGVGNEATQSFTFGSFFDVFVDLNIPTPGSDGNYNTTTFGLAIYDQNGNPVQSDPTGFSGDFAVSTQPNPDGTYLVSSFGPTVTPQQPSPIPEPSTLTLTALGFVGLAGAARRRRRTPLGEI